jgi:hypothetical protein
VQSVHGCVFSALKCKSSSKSWCAPCTKVHAAGRELQSCSLSSSSYGQLDSKPVAQQAFGSKRQAFPVGVVDFDQPKRIVWLISPKRKANKKSILFVSTSKLCREVGHCRVLRCSPLVVHTSWHLCMQQTAPQPFFFVLGFRHARLMISPQNQPFLPGSEKDWRTKIPPWRVATMQSNTVLSQDLHPLF